MFKLLDEFGTWARTFMTGMYNNDPKVLQTTSEGVLRVSLENSSEGSGDMNKSVYDTDDDGIVDAAEEVPWTGVTSKPSTYPPESHTHTETEITDLSHDADLIKGKSVDTPSTDNRYAYYDAGTDSIKWGDVSSGITVSGINNSFVEIIDNGLESISSLRTLDNDITFGDGGEEDFLDITFSSDSGAGNNGMQQTFTAPRSGFITGGTARLAILSGTVDVTFSLRRSEEVLDSYTTSISNTSFEDIPFTFDNIPVSNGSVYNLRVTHSSGSVYWKYSDSSVYDGGNFSIGGDAYMTLDAVSPAVKIKSDGDIDFNVTDKGPVIKNVLDNTPFRIVISGDSLVAVSTSDPTDSIICGTITSTNIDTFAVTDVNSKGTGSITLTQDDVGDGSTYVRTENNLTDTLKTKLDGIEVGAEVNVNADWDSSSGDSQILNKPTVSSIRTFTWSVCAPAVGGIPGPRIPERYTATRIDAYTTESGETANFNIEERSTIGSAGTNLVTSDLTADDNGVNTTTFSNSSLDSGNWLWLDISSVSSSDGYLVVTLTMEVH